MRKRIVIGAIAVVVMIGVAVWYSSHTKRRENSVDYHKAQYIAARDGKPTLMWSVWFKFTGQTAPRRVSVEKLRRHDEALLRLGYWREQTFTVSNKQAATVWGIAIKHGANLWQPELTKEICVAAPIGTNTIMVRAMPEHIPIWADLIREADVL